MQSSRRLACAGLHALAALLLFAACASPAVAPRSETADRIELLARPDFPWSPPAIPGPQPAIQRSAAASELQFSGVQHTALSAGTLSYSPAAAPDSLVLVPALGGAEPGSSAAHSAWALYHFPDRLLERPQRLRTDVAAAGVSDGSPPVALSYYVGLADFTRAAWEWQGPFSADADIVLNHAGNQTQPARRQRLIDADGNCYVCVLVDSQQVSAGAGNPLGQAAVALASVSLTASSNTVATKPLYLSPSLVKTGARAEASRQASTLKPSQFPLVAWVPHLESLPQHAASQALTVNIYRQGPGQSAALLVGQRDQLNATFTDPLNLLAGVDGCRGGETYRFLIQAVNGAGVTAPAAGPLITVPMLAPELVTASQNSAGGSGCSVGWQPADGAVVYHIWRGLFADGNSAQHVGQVNAPALVFNDSGGQPGQMYWYFVQAEGRGDGNAANGLESGALSSLSAPAQGLRGFVLDLSCGAGASGGNGSAGSPYLLQAGQEAVFIVHDQLGNVLTVACSFSTLPAGTGTFAGAPGVMSPVAPGSGQFAVEARLSHLGFEWTATAQCLAP